MSKYIPRCLTLLMAVVATAFLAGCGDGAEQNDDLTMLAFRMNKN